MSELKKKELKIIKLLKESPKSFKELKDSGEKMLQSDATLSRLLKNLKNLNLIEDIQVNESKSRIKKRYFLTDKYHNQQEIKEKDSQLSKMISTRLNWQNVFNKMSYYLELEYPMVSQMLSNVNAKDIYSDIFSYLVFFELDNEIISKDSKSYFDLMLYLTSHHPDEKYKLIIEEITFKQSDLKTKIDRFKAIKKLEEFHFNDPLALKQTKFYLISDDPMIYRIRQYINIQYIKFLICWQFPDALLEENFDFIFQFSYFILDEQYNFYNNRGSENQLKFIFNNNICFLVYIREYTLEFLEKIRIKRDDDIHFIEYPLELLPNEQKYSYRSELILSSEILSSKDQKYIEKCFNSLEKLKEQQIEEIIRYIEKLVKRIGNYMGNPYENEKVLLLKTHVMLLLRIFYHIDRKSYRDFKNTYVEKKNLIKLSYRNLSEDIFNSIIKLKFGLSRDDEFIKRSFTIRQFLERIDHLLNKLKKGKKKVETIIEKIKEIFKIASEYFSEKSYYPFFKKKCEIFLKNYSIFTESEILDLFKYLYEKYLRNLDIANLILNLSFNNIKFIDFVNKLILNNEWQINDKINLIIPFINQIPKNFDIENYFNLNLDNLKNEFNISNDPDRKNLTKLCKILAVFSEKKGYFHDSFIYYYLATISEQKEVMNPLNKEIISQIFPIFTKNSEHFKLESPAFLNLLNVYEELGDNLFQNFKLNTSIASLIFMYLNKSELRNKIELITKSTPLLIEALIELAKYLKIDLDFKIIPKKSKKLSDEQNLVDNRDRINNEERENLELIVEKLQEYSKKTKTSSFITGIWEITFFLKDRISAKEVEDTLGYELNGKTDIPDHYPILFNGLKEFTNLQGIFPNIERYYNFEFQNRSNPFFMSMFDSNITSSQVNIQDNYIIQMEFTSKREDLNYVFNLAFKKKYFILKNKPQNYWNNLFKQLENSPHDLIQLLDLYLYHTRYFVDFPNLEKISKLILEMHNIDWAIRYVNSFITYMKWYYQRLENSPSLEVPYSLRLEILFKFLNFFSEIIKATLYWEYRERNNAQNFVLKAFDSLKYIELHTENQFEFPMLSIYKEKLENLYKKTL